MYVGGTWGDSYFYVVCEQINHYISVQTEDFLGYLHLITALYEFNVGSIYASHYYVDPPWKTYTYVPE